MIPITRPFLPPLGDYEEYLKQIWNRNWLTNDGPLVRELEGRLKEYLDVDNVLVLANGTIALQIAIKALGLGGEIITTPFSYVATTSSIVWENCKPVFVDIDPETLNIDPNLIETAISDRTSGILATHVFGNPCDIHAIEKLARNYTIPIIYDAAHCFGVKYRGRSIFAYGNISATSFHATKLFHTVEGGAVFTSDVQLNKRMAYMRNFGHDGPGRFNGVGINGKNSELHAAMGLVTLPYIDQLIRERMSLSKFYHERLQSTSLRFQRIESNTCYNYAYYPVIFEHRNLVEMLIDEMEAAGIFPRRYFFPSLSKLSYVSYEFLTPLADEISERILCLPLYNGMTSRDQERVTSLILNYLE